jgi:hypothetical protein
MRVRLLLVVLLSMAASVSATTIVPMDDADLVRTSAVVAVGTVRRLETQALRDGRLVTEITLDVEQRVKGGLASRVVVITQPGGRVPGRMVWVDGTPEFTRGARMLVFLERTRDGRLRTTGMALGAYRVGPDGMVRREIPRPDVRPLDPFVERLRALARREPVREESDGGVARRRDEVVQRMVTERFTLLGAPPGRWTTATVAYRVANQEAALTSAASNNAVTAAMAAWTDVATSDLTLTKGAATATAASIAGGACDGVSTIQFNDPLDEIPSLAGCTGVLAVGGFCVTEGTSTVGGITYDRIGEGDVTMNAGVGACFGATGIAEVMTHELGHTIGLGHSSEDPDEPDPALADATMYFLAHIDGRGASLRADDRAGMTTIYPGAAASAPDGDEDSVPDASDDCPSTAERLAVDVHGCACADAGHASCDDADLCTTDGCNAANSACTHAPVVCDDADGCTADACTPATGCTFTPIPDGDDDGLCDAIDDSDGDGVVDLFDACPGTATGLAADATGCACADVGHLACDDGDACTTESCDVASGLCVGTPVACDDGDPCTADACDAAAGCTHAAAVDTDGDGRCDALDVCPRLASADDADGDGDGVGDACSCTAARPGRCIPAPGKPIARCLAEWHPEVPAAVRKGFPSPTLRCHDGDPGCDADDVAGQCTLRAQLCINNADPRFPSCIPLSTTTLTVRTPHRARDAADAANMTTLAGALDLHAQSRNQCSGPLALVVPTRGARPGRKVVKVAVTTQSGRAQSVLKLVCEP